MVCATSAFASGAEGRRVDIFEIAMFVAATRANVTTSARARCVVDDMMYLPLLVNG
jgi:hypothetical protein